MSHGGASGCLTIDYGSGRWYSNYCRGGEKRLPGAHFDSLTSAYAKASADKATSLEPPKTSLTYLRRYASGFFGVSALFRQNSHNAHNRTFFSPPR